MPITSWLSLVESFQKCSFYHMVWGLEETSTFGKHVVSPCLHYRSPHFKGNLTWDFRRYSQLCVYRCRWQWHRWSSAVLHEINSSPIITITAIVYCRCQRHWRWNVCNNMVLPTPQSEHKVKNHYMNVNSNPAPSHQNMKNFLDSEFFSFIAGVIDTGN